MLAQNCSATRPLARDYMLKVQPRADREPPAAGCGGEAAERHGIDVQVEPRRVALRQPIAAISEIGMVQDVGSNYRQFELLVLRNPDSLEEVCVQPEIRRSLDPTQAQIADLSRSRIREKHAAFRIGDRLVAE